MSGQRKERSQPSLLGSCVFGAWLVVLFVLSLSTRERGGLSTSAGLSHLQSGTRTRVDVFGLLLSLIPRLPPRKEAKFWFSDPPR